MIAERMKLESNLSRHGQPRGGYAGWGDAEGELPLVTKAYDFFPPDYEKALPEKQEDEQLHHLMEQLAREAAIALRVQREERETRWSANPVCQGGGSDSKELSRAYHEAEAEEHLDELAVLKQYVRNQSEEQIRALSGLKREIDSKREAHEARREAESLDLRGAARLRRLVGGIGEDMRRDVEGDMAITGGMAPVQVQDEIAAEINAARAEVGLRERARARVSDHAGGRDGTMGVAVELAGGLASLPPETSTVAIEDVEEEAPGMAGGY